MSTTETPVEPVAENGAAPSVGQWAELPVADKKNGPNSKFAPELNATARESAEHPGQARIISIQKSIRSASGRASTIKRKLREGKVNGLEFPVEHFEIVPRGNVVYATYTPPVEKAATDKPQAKAEAKSEAKPDPKPRAGRK